ncbi:MAG TPA: CHAT domain-containing protein [Bryobacteraceae bacterium]|nr:CHAT domain-containing protein [Bryobacteraceae bacterium]
MRQVVLVAGFAFLVGCNQLRSLRGADSGNKWRETQYERYRVDGLKALQKRDYRQAVRTYTEGAQEAQRAGDQLSRGRLLANLSAAYQLLFDNRAAIQSLLAARQTAEAAGDQATVQAVEANLANLYIQTGDTEAAGAAAVRGAAIRPAKQDAQVRVSVLMSFGRAVSKARGLAAAEPMLREALWAAADLGAPAMEAEVLELWGNEALEADELAKAEDLLARGWWKRKLAKDARMPQTEAKLGRLYRKLERYEFARFWMDRVLAAAAAGAKIAVPEWSLAAEQGHVYAAEGRLREALASYRGALQWARTWRSALPRSERLRAGAERRMLELFDGHIRTASRLYRQKPDGELSAEMFTVIQTTRAWSMEGTREGGAADTGLYERARRLEGQWLGGDAAAEGQLRVVRAAILEAESAKGKGETERSSRLEAPAPGEAILTYWLDDEGSWLWTWSEGGLRLTSLPGREQILREAEAFRNAVALNQPAMRERGDQLLRTLLGGLRQECLRAKRWEIVADEGLFQVPFAALPLGDGTYLAERMEVRLIPNALRQTSKTRASRRFLAVADPIFNAADERREQGGWRQGRVHASHFALELPRLPGTRREAEAGIRAWKDAGYDTALQLGAESSEEAVLSRFNDWQPGIIHIATHTATPSNDLARPRLALSIRPDGSPGLLAAGDIAALPLRADLVVMSACHSVGAESARGAGMLGLTRAWLTAGSQQVLATLWPVSDESTAFFKAFHGRLAAEERADSLPVAAALREAQLVCLRSGGAIAEPRYWAGHVVLARR